MTSETELAGADIFNCKNCGACCRGFGGTYVTRENIEAIAGFFGTNPDRVLEKYCQTSGRKTVIAQKPDGYCVFWDGNCTIHPVKPRMCRAWPFIEGVLRAPENWRIMADSCPGITPDVSEPALVACVRYELARLDSHNAILP